MAAANNIVGEVGLLVKPVDPNAQFQANLDQIIKRLEKQAQFQIKATGADQVQEQANGIANSFANAALQAGAFTAAIYGVRAVVEGTIGKLAGLFDQLAKAQAGFTAILGSQSAGDQLLGQIQEFARISPFATQELVNYSQQLLGVGVASQKIVPLLEDVGNIVASVGGDTQNIGRVLFTLTQIQSIGRLAGQDAMQLQSALIPITKYLAEYLGKTTAQVKKLQEQGAISAETVFAAIQAQGDKVKGAMDNATRNISGAQAVLSDTITIFLQNQPVLQKVFEDVYKGILKFATYLGSEEFTTAATSFFTQVDRIYESLKPFFSALVDSGAVAGMTTLTIMTDVLGTLATVLDAIPEPVLRLLAQYLTLMATLKAPLMLLRYVDSIKTLSGLVTNGTLANRIAGTTAQIEQQGVVATRTAAAIERLAAAQASNGVTGAINGSGAGRFVANNSGALRTGLGMAGLIGGQAISDGNGGERDAVGNIATYAGLGLAVGGLPGALVGGALGAATSIWKAFEDAAEAKKKALADAGTAIADGFLEGFNKSFADPTSPEALEAFFGGVQTSENMIGLLEGNKQSAEARIAELERMIDAVANANVETDPLNPLAGWDPEQMDKDVKMLQGYYEEIDRLKDDIKVNNDAIAIQETAIAEQMANPETLQFFTDLNTKLLQVKQLAGDMDIFGAGGRQINAERNPGLFGNEVYNDRLIQLLTGQQVVETAEDYKMLNDALADTGHTMQWFAEQSAETIVRVLNIDVSSAFAKAALEASKFNEAIEAGTKAATERWGAFGTQIATIGKQISDTIALNSTLGGLFETKYDAATDTINTALKGDATDPRNINSIGSQLVSSAQLAQAAEYQRVLEEVSLTMDKTQAEAFAANRAAEFGTLRLKGEFDALQSTLGLTDRQFRELLESAGLWNTYAAATADAGDTITGSYAEVATALGLTVDNLSTILGLKEDIDGNATLVIDVDTANAIEQLASINDQLANYGGRATPTTLLNQKAYYEGIIAAGGVNAFDPTLDKSAAEKARLDELDRLEKERIAAEKEAARLAEEWARKVESATESMTSAVENAANMIAEAAQAWVGSIKERTQYESAVSVGRLTRNTERQIADITEVTAARADLIARGVTPAVMAALGIDNITDTRQLRRLTRASNEDLARLTGLVAERDALATNLATEAEDVRTQKNIEQGIVNAAKTLGIDFTKEQAAGLAAQFNITAGANAEEIALQILNILTSGRIG